LKAGLSGLPSWKALQSIAQALTKESAKVVLAAIATARSRAEEAMRLLDKGAKDSKFRLKAVAAQWHSQHKSGTVEDCPLCEHDLTAAPSLAQELEALRSVGDAATRAFTDNLNAITAELESSFPVSLRTYGLEILTWEPSSRLSNEIRTALVAKERYSKLLTKFGALVDAALVIAPVGESAAVTVPSGPDVLKSLNERLAVNERILDLAEWFGTQSIHWSDWWETLAAPETAKEQVLPPRKSNPNNYRRISCVYPTLSQKLSRTEKVPRQCGRRGSRANPRPKWKRN
jgi:hypothetical protein